MTPRCHQAARVAGMSVTALRLPAGGAAPIATRRPGARLASACGGSGGGMGIVPLTFAAALVLGGLLAPIVTGDSEFWAGTAVAWVLAVGLVVVDRMAARRRTSDESA